VETATEKKKPALVLHDKLAIMVGTFNGVEYTEPEIKKLYNIYKTIENKPMEERSIDEIHAFDIQRGADEDHKDSTGTWVGDVEGVYWDDNIELPNGTKTRGFGFKNWNIVEQDFANKIEYQKARGKSSFGVSPRLNVLRVGTKATEILPKNLSIVLTPAGGEQLLLSKEEEQPGREIRQDFVTDITLSERNQLFGGNTEMELDGKELMKKFDELLTKINPLKTEEKREDMELKLKIESLEKEKKTMNEKLEKIEKSLADKTEEEKKKEAEMQKKLADEKKKAEEEACKKAELEKQAADEKKYKYYGALSNRENFISKLAVAPDLSRLDPTSINRVAEDIANAASLFGNEFTLEKAQKGIDELFTILSNLPKNEKQEAAVLQRLEETLSQAVAPEKNSDKETKPPASRRKGLIVPGIRGEETLSQKDTPEKKDTEKGVEDIKSEMTGLLMSGLGIKK